MKFYQQQDELLY